MSYNLKDIRNLRVEWRGDHTGGMNGAIHFESGTERFHIWLYTPHHIPVEQIDDGDLPFNMRDTLYANDIDAPQFGHRNTRKSDLSKASHRKLRDLIASRIQVKFGNLNAAVRKAALAYVMDRDAKQAQMKADLANNIRAAIVEAMNKADNLSAKTVLSSVSEISDEAAIALRSALYNTKHPDAREYDGNGVIDL